MVNYTIGNYLVGNGPVGPRSTIKKKKKTQIKQYFVETIHYMKSSLIWRHLGEKVKDIFKMLDQKAHIFFYKVILKIYWNSQESLS